MAEPRTIAERGEMMASHQTAPVRLGRMRSLRALAGIAMNPLLSLRQLHSANGPFVILQYPHSHHDRPQILMAIANADLHREVSSDTRTWRGVNVGMRAIRNHAVRRLGYGVTRLHGSRHAHYRRLIALPMSKPEVAAMAPDMAVIAKRHVEAWPRDQAIDLVPLASNLVQDLAISLLFGDDRTRALPIAHMIADAANAAWPFPRREWLRWLRTAPKLEVAINEWADEKRGELNPKDIFSVLVNNPDEHGREPDRSIIGGILTFTFGAAYETCQNALLWTLVLLSQHPAIAQQLTEEIEGALHGDLPTMDKIDRLPLLEGVIRESMRLFPPVPLQFRRSMAETQLGGAPIPAKMRVLISAWLINRNPDCFPEPDRFIPERWADLKPSPNDYPVFGAGGRMCPGAAFGNQMAKIALSTVLATHRVELAQRAHVNFRNAITLTPHPALPVVLRETSTSPNIVPLSGRATQLFHMPEIA